VILIVLFVPVVFGEQSIPCTAALVQKQLGGEFSGIPSFDINSTCLSFVVGLDTLSYLVDAGRYSRVLLVASEITRGIDWKDQESSTLFGDGAAAAIIGKTDIQEGSKIICSRLETYSQGADLSQCLGAGNRYHPREYSDNAHRYLVSFVVEFNPKQLPQNGQSVGIDLGITDFATLSNGEKIKHGLNGFHRFHGLRSLTINKVH
jgi:3-oxoacyl-[acyl-carrier-protein] synthase III